MTRSERWHNWKALFWIVCLRFGQSCFLLIRNDFLLIQRNFCSADYRLLAVLGMFPVEWIMLLIPSNQCGMALSVSQWSLIHHKNGKKSSKYYHFTGKPDPNGHRWVYQNVKFLLLLTLEVASLILCWLSCVFAVLFSLGWGLHPEFFDILNILGHQKSPPPRLNFCRGHVLAGILVRTAGRIFRSQTMYRPKKKSLKHSI